MAQKPGSKLAAILLPYPSALLARRCGVTVRTAQRWRSGGTGANDNLPKLEQLPVLARVTRTPLAKLRAAWAADRRVRA